MQAKAKIMVVRDIERDDIEYISKTLNCLPIAHADHMKPEKLGHADRVDEVQVSQVSISYMQGVIWWLLAYLQYTCFGTKMSLNAVAWTLPESLSRKAVFMHS